MENFGLLTFKESLLLIDQSNFSVQTRAEVALVVAHEIAHQWFGNIVTMEWWTDLWLNEGFATWIEYLCIDYCFPDWNIWNLYATDHLYRAFNLDGLKSSHPIEVNVGLPSEINQIFDSISYCKGSAVLRMLNDYVGKDAFIKGLQNYLQKFEFRNATSEDLWNEIDYASNKSVKQMMQAWTKEQGYPVVYASSRLDQNKNTILILEQEQFYNCPLEKTEHNDKIWNIPISIVIKSSFPNIFKAFLLDKKICEFELGKIEDDEWIKINADNIGFYKVNYSKELFDRFFRNLDDTIKLGSSLDRYGLINDAFSFVFSGDLKAGELMRVLKIFKNETDAHVWITIFKNLHFLSKCLLDRSYFAEYKKFLADLIIEVKKKIGFEVKPNEDDLVKLLKENVLYILAKIDDPEFRDFAIESYKNRSNKKIPCDLQKAVYTCVLRNGDSSVIDEFIELYQKSPTPEEKEKTAILLGEVCSSELIDKVLNLSISSIVTLEETVFMIVSVAKNSTNPISLDKAWNFVKDNWSLFVNRYADSVILGRLLKPLIENFSTDEKLLEVEKFFKENPVPQADQAIKQAIELARSNIYFLEKQDREFELFFS
ncbi:unnamed protein product [Brachionus calyciflorus]|uniref:Aminopeptidase n=1 Tax=Brachionus calyciflorus TaxID=104777 RepID=A0A814CIC1_9BILA|nr:unnamed protein product [Brachionus calyciflorus]